MTSRPRWYIGLAATMHDPALAIVDSRGEIVFAESVERYLQCKRAYNCPPDDMIRMPQLVREYCPADAELVVAISWSRAQLSQLERSTQTWYVPERASIQRSGLTWPFPSPRALATALRNSLSQAGLCLATSLQIENPITVRHYDHHLCHAALAAHRSGFDECAVAVVDGFGEHGPTSCYRYAGGMLTPLQTKADSTPPASLGFYYARLCALCGFDPVKGEEWKVMGLAAYGAADPRLYQILEALVRVHDLGVVSTCSPADETARIQVLRSEMERRRRHPLGAADLARTGQLVFEQVMTTLLETLYDRSPSPNLAFAGGCALNSTYNGRILERTRFKNLHVPCAPGDDGTAIGAALLAFQEDSGWKGDIPEGGLQSPYLGSRIPTLALQHLVEFGGLSRITHAPVNIHERAAELLDNGKVLGWIQGRAEFGPRALGNRSVLADPRPPWMKDRINNRVKFREEFRPFAPSILDEQGDDYFECYHPSPYMERTLRFRPQMAPLVPAVVHVDGTGRVQSVRRQWNPRFYDLIEAFARRTGVPLILNTSLNVMGKPIVHSLQDALGMFLTTGLDALVVEDYLIEKPASG